MFGYDPQEPAPFYCRLAGFALMFVGWFIGPAPLFVLGAILALVGFIIGWRKPARDVGPLSDERLDALSSDEFEQQLRDYEAGRRDTPPGH